MTATKLYKIEWVIQIGTPQLLPKLKAIHRQTCKVRCNLVPKNWMKYSENLSNNHNSHSFSYHAQVERLTVEKKVNKIWEVKMNKQLSSVTQFPRSCPLHFKMLYSTSLALSKKNRSCMCNTVSSTDVPTMQTTHNSSTSWKCSYSPFLFLFFFFLHSGKFKFQARQAILGICGHLTRCEPIIRHLWWRIEFHDVILPPL